MKMTTTLSGLRLYVNSSSIALPSGIVIDEEEIEAINVFYSRRGNGPIYRWLFEEKLAHWRALRMHAADFDSHKLRHASWKSVPEKLQEQLGAHYSD
jgi:hypothetical protein